MKRVKGWWFAPHNRKLANGDGRKIDIGIIHRIEGEIVPCNNGLHLSSRALDALTHAQGPIVYRVEGRGTIVPHGTPVDKYVCSEREYLAGGVDCSETLLGFARMCALDVVHLWDAPDVVQRFLKTGEETLRDTAWAVAWSSTKDSARTATLAAARTAAWTAAKETARAAARAEARATAKSTAWATALAAARVVARTAQNRRLTAMLSAAIERGGLSPQFQRNDLVVEI